MKYCAINKNVEKSKGLILWFKNRINFTKHKLVIILIVVSTHPLAQFLLSHFLCFTRIKEKAIVFFFFFALFE